MPDGIATGDGLPGPTRKTANVETRKETTMIKTNLTAMILAAALSGPAAADGLTRFDVAEDLSRFVYAETQRFDDGMPAYGNAFVTQGYIYPAGTLDGGVEGTLADGTPAFPDKVLGTWTCDGYFVGDGMRTETGTIVITRQVYQFEGGDLLIAQGPEIVEIGVPVDRAVTGGTGDYADAGPVLTQVLLGMTDGYGVRLQLSLSDGRQASLAPDATAWETDVVIE
jgi:hypothetical protein